VRTPDVGDEALRPGHRAGHCELHAGTGGIPPASPPRGPPGRTGSARTRRRGTGGAGDERERHCATASSTGRWPRMTRAPGRPVRSTEAASPSRSLEPGSRSHGVAPPGSRYGPQPSGSPERV